MRCSAARLLLVTVAAVAVALSAATLCSASVLVSHSPPTAASGVRRTVSIIEFGAVPNNTSMEATYANTRAIAAAIKNVTTPNAMAMMDSSHAPGVPAAASGGTVVIPSGLSFTAYPVGVVGVSGLVLQIDGTLLASKNISGWPVGDNKRCLDFLSFSNVSDITITGHGLIDGQGYDWWWLTIFTVIHKQRPHLVVFDTARNIVVENIRMKNSPSFHLRTQRTDTAVFRGIDIHVDVDQQLALFREAGALTSITHPVTLETIEIPTFPLNTDGIDPAGQNIHIYNCTIENFDDAVAVKPSHAGDVTPCSSDMLIENCTVSFGVGMTIGSVPPNPQVNCVANITFRNIVMHHPIKAIYVKTNPGTDGYGVIKNITYEGFRITRPLWWGIYIGPQQQRQPDGSGPGCMLYPLDTDCETQPRVPISDVTLRNIISIDGLLSPGIIRCNATKPCTGITFDNVHVQAGSWPADNYICENVFLSANDTFPIPPCHNTTASPRRAQGLAQAMMAQP